MKHKNKKEFEIIFVTWVDPYSVDSWTDVEDLPMDPAYITSSGYFVKETKSCIAIAPNIGDATIDNQVSCATIIPKRCIISMYIVRKSYVKKYDLD